MYLMRFMFQGSPEIFWARLPFVPHVGEEITISLGASHRTRKQPMRIHGKILRVHYSLFEIQDSFYGLPTSLDRFPEQCLFNVQMEKINECPMMQMLNDRG